MTEEQETFSLLVDTVGWVESSNLSREEIEKLYNSYVDSGGYEQVTLWSSLQEDPIEEYNRNDILHICKFCDCEADIDDCHTCLEFTEASEEGNALHELYEEVMNGFSTGFTDLEGNDE